MVAFVRLRSCYFAPSEGRGQGFESLRVRQSIIASPIAGAPVASADRLVRRSSPGDRVEPQLLPREVVGGRDPREFGFLHRHAHLDQFG